MDPITLSSLELMLVFSVASVRFGLEIFWVTGFIRSLGSDELWGLV